MNTRTPTLEALRAQQAAVIRKCFSAKTDAELSALEEQSRALGRQIAALAKAAA
jgi:hypothetical protein